MLNNKEMIKYDVMTDREKLANKIARQQYENKIDRVKDVRNLHKLKQLEGLLLWYSQSHDKLF